VTKRSKPPEHSLVASPDSDLAGMIESYDENALSRAKSLWYSGDWQTLAATTLEEIQTHPERSTIALLVACAHQNLDAHDTANVFVQQAKSWGADNRIAAQILISNVHNTLGRIAAIKAVDERAKSHFDVAISIGTHKDSKLVSHARAFRETVSLGLLPDAKALIGEEIKALPKIKDRAALEAATMVLQTELNLIGEELTLALRRNQLFAKGIQKSDGPQPNDEEDLAKSHSVSQLGQDLWVLARTNYKNGGYFVEFGATNGVLLSNTYLLEQSYGWRGLLAEPNPKFWEELNANRTAECRNACISARTGDTVEFLLADAFGTIRDFASSDMHEKIRHAYENDERNIILLETISLADFLQMNNAPREIDYISVDTEGSELAILETFPFDRWRVTHWTVEHNFSKDREKIFELMTRNGYRRVKAQWDDWYYLDDN